MNKGLLIGGAVVVAVALVGARAMGFGGSKMLDTTHLTGGQSTPVASGSSTSNRQVTAGSSTAESAEILASADPYPGKVTQSGGFTGDVVEGDPNAAITVIEYASLTCPHCAAFHSQTYKRLKADYIDTGKIKFIYRDYPLGNEALSASIIARCGGEDKFLAFIDLFLTQQERWTRSADWMGELQKMARFGGLTADKINACLADQELGQSVVNRTRAASQVFRVNSTPTVIINGDVYSGGRDFRSMSQALDSML